MGIWWSSYRTQVDEHGEKWFLETVYRVGLNVNISVRWLAQDSTDSQRHLRHRVTQLFQPPTADKGQTHRLNRYGAPKTLFTTLSMLILYAWVCALKSIRAFIRFRHPSHILLNSCLDHVFKEISRLYPLVLALQTSKYWEALFQHEIFEACKWLRLDHRN